MAKVKVYSTPNCPWCHKAKQFLRENKVDYEDLDVSEDQKAATEMVNKTGRMSVPVIDIGGQIIIGFDEPKIMQALAA